MTPTPNSLPKNAIWLGLAGLLPQLLACVLDYTSRDWGAYITVSGFAYAALIFSFLGGIWWGNAMSATKSYLWIFIAAVCPSLIAWISALLLFTDLKWWPYATSAVAIGLIISPLVDQQIGNIITQPKGWMKLRWILSIGLGCLTLVMATLPLHTV
jgi:MFS family permease